MTFTEIDPAKILSYGVMGLGFLLGVLAFWLLQRKQVTFRATISFMIFAVVLVSLGLASEWLRMRFALTPKNAWFEMPGAPKPCSAREKWPQATWTLWGRFEDHTLTDLNSDFKHRIPQVFWWANFTSAHAFDSQTEEGAEPDPKNGSTSNPLDRVYRAASVRGQLLTPGGPTVEFDGHDNTKGVVDGKRYEMQEWLTATPDGCMINGYFKDNRGNSGNEHYLYPSDHYFVPYEAPKS